MNKRITALAISGLLVAGPSALAVVSAQPAGALPGYGLEHSGHDHHKPKKHRHGHGHGHGHDGHGHGHGHHGHGHGHHHGHHHGDSAHASGGYDAHRRHPRH